MAEHVQACPLVYVQSVHPSPTLHEASPAVPDAGTWSEDRCGQGMGTRSCRRLPVEASREVTACVQRANSAWVHRNLRNHR